MLIAGGGYSTIPTDEPTAFPTMKVEKMATVESSVATASAKPKETFSLSLMLLVVVAVALVGFIIYKLIKK